MIARLGNVVCWVTCVLAAGWLVMLVGLQRHEADPEWGKAWIAGLVVAAIIWLCGRTIKYILD
jgi:hypothetical protein